MRKFLLLLLLPFFSFTDKEEKTTRISGYFLVYAFKPAYKCSCGLNIPTAESMAADSMKKQTCLCDGNYYKNFGTIRFVKTADLDLGKIDDYNYQAKLSGSGKEMLMFLSTNKNILHDAFSKDTSLVNDKELIQQIESDTVTADAIAKLIDGAKLNFTKKTAYEILLKADVTVLRLKNSPKPKDYADGMGHEQYLFLNDPTNHIEFVKVIADPF